SVTTRRRSYIRILALLKVRTTTLTFRRKTEPPSDRRPNLPIALAIPSHFAPKPTQSTRSRALLRPAPHTEYTRLHASAPRLIRFRPIYRNERRWSRSPPGSPPRSV